MGSSTGGMPGSGLRGGRRWTPRAIPAGSEAEVCGPAPEDEQPASTAIPREREGLKITESPTLLLRSGDGLVKIPDDIVDILDADRDSHQVRADAGRELLLVV